MINLIKNKNNIKFLFDLHHFLNVLKYEINNNNSKINQFKQCYLIKKELIDIYNNFYEVGNVLKISEANINEMLISNDFDNLDLFYEQLIENHQKIIGNNKDIKDINYQLKGKDYLVDVFPTQYNNENFKCFEDFVISDKDFEKNKNIYTFQYTIIEHKIILVFNHTMNIGILDQNNYIFVPEAIIKFKTNEDFNDIINKIIKYGINYVESYFQSINNNANISILLLGNKDENYLQNKRPKINNFFNKNTTQIMPSSSNEFNFETSKIKNQLRMEKEKENFKKKIQSLKTVLSMMIDNEKIKRKMNRSLKGSKEEKFYLLNKNWFTEYIALKKMTEIINDLIEGKIIESYIRNETDENNPQQNHLYTIEEIIKNLENDKIGKISCNDVYLSQLSNKDSYGVEWEYIYKDKEKNKLLIYYRDFILISYETKELLLSEFPSQYRFYLDFCQALLGNNKIFVIFSAKNLIEVCHFDKKNDIQPIMFFEHSDSIDLNKNLNLLTSYDFADYTKYFLLFNDDYISPIFDKNNNKIGQAYRYNEDLIDYSKYLSQEKIVKNLIKLYFSNFILKTKFNNKIVEKEFYIIDEKYLKNFGIYTMIENSLNQFDLTMELNEILNSEDREYKFEELIESKKMSIKTKKLISECKDIFSNQNNIVESNIPNLVSYNCNGNDFFYIDNFRLIEASLGNQLIESKIIMYKNLSSFNIVKCILIEKYILIDISNNNNKDTFHRIYEVCEVNEQNLIKPMYILAYYSSNYLISHLKHIFNNIGYTFQNFLEGYSYQQGNGIELSIETNSGEIKVGFVYKLSSVSPNQNQILSNNNHVSINNSNINIINNNPNININISCSPSFQAFNQGNNNISNISNVNFGQNQIIQSVNPMPISDRIPERIPERIPGPIDSIDKEYITHPLVGLKNVGATCYMNATLQCLLNLKKFVNFFKYKLKSEHLRKIKNKRYTNLTESFKYLIENVWMTPGNNYYLPKYNSKNANNRYFIPKKFKEKISIMNPLFQGAQANDAKDLVNFLIMTLHEELNKADNNQNVNSSNILIDQSNRDLVLKNFSECFVKENMSLISDLFYAMNNNVTECCNCHNKKYNFQIYFFLNFPLEEVRKFKIQMQVDQFCQSNQNMYMMNQMMFQQNVSIFQNNLNNTINTVNLDDCFLYNQKIENFSGPNAMYCNSCKIQANAYYRTLLSTGPEILVIILNRGKGKEFNVKCDFVQQLNLSNYIEMKNTGFMYDLVGVVTHMGESGGSGHFIAVCRSPIDQQQWYKYNDDLVFPVGNFVTEVINYAMPYILFYQKKNK